MNRTASFVLKQMRTKGSTLHCSFERGKTVWFLSSDRRPLADGVGVAVSRDQRVVGVGDALLQGVPSQTFCYTEELEQDAH
jgi:hypothetical protein